MEKINTVMKSLKSWRLTLFFKLKYEWSTILCRFLVCSQVIQLHVYVCVCVFFLDSFLLWFITEYLVYFPVLCNRTLLLYYFTYKNLYLLIPNSWFLPQPPSLSFLVTTSLFSVCDSVHFCHILDSEKRWYHKVFVYIAIFFTLQKVPIWKWALLDMFSSWKSRNTYLI